MIDSGVIITGLALAILLLPGSLWLLEVLVGLLPESRERLLAQKKISSVILIPAHNEEQVLKSTLDGLSIQLTDGDTVLVVADNCNDASADIAMECGMVVAERNHDTQRGKGYALAHGIAEIGRRGWEPDVVIVLDADCEILPGGLAQLKQDATVSPVQGRYLLTAPEGAGPKQKVSAFAIYVKNHIRLLGLSRLGGSVPITGSGFGAPFSLFKEAELASGEIVEDMKLGCDWVLQNQFTRYAPHVHILSSLPEDEQSADTQRQRWEHGHVSIITRYMPRLLIKAIARLRLAYLITAMDMAVPPLIFMVASYTLLAVALLALSWKASAVVFSYLFLVVAALTLVNLLSKPQCLKSTDVVGFFKFACSKLTLYRKLATSGKSGWVKTKRDHSTK